MAETLRKQNLLQFIQLRMRGCKEEAELAKPEGTLCFQLEEFSMKDPGFITPLFLFFIMSIIKGEGEDKTGSSKIIIKNLLLNIYQQQKKKKNVS